MKWVVEESIRYIKAEHMLSFSLLWSTPAPVSQPRPTPLDYCSTYAQASLEKSLLTPNECVYVVASPANGD